ncbi:hypothetical protein NL676_034204 [Syzygium grande]|nr:hypothetical protein NL676_034204 [Syzygium grande]
MRERAAAVVVARPASPVRRRRRPGLQPVVPSPAPPASHLAGGSRKPRLSRVVAFAKRQRNLPPPFTVTLARSIGTSAFAS